MPLDETWLDRIDEPSTHDVGMYGARETSLDQPMNLAWTQHDEAEDDDEPRAEPRTDALADLRGIVVVAVDDEDDLRELIAETLLSRGATVHVARSAREALRLVATVRPDVLVSDIGLPEEDGYALITQVRALDANDGGLVPAIALTGRSSLAESHKALVAGFQVHVAKPVDPWLLVEAVANVAGSVPLPH